MAERTVVGHSLEAIQRRNLVRDNLTVIFAVAGPALFLSLAAVGVMKLGVASLALIGELQKPAELHTGGMITDGAFANTKEKLLNM